MTIILFEKKGELKMIVKRSEIMSVVVSIVGLIILLSFPISCNISDDLANFFGETTLHIPLFMWLMWIVLVMLEMLSFDIMDGFKMYLLLIFTIISGATLYLCNIGAVGMFFSLALVFISLIMHLTNSAVSLYMYYRYRL